MPDDDTLPSIDDLLDADPSTDDPTPTEVVPTSTPWSIDELLAAYDETDEETNLPADDTGAGHAPVDEELSLADLFADDTSHDDGGPDEPIDAVGPADAPIADGEPEDALDAEELLELVERAAGELAATAAAAPVDGPAADAPVEEEPAAADVRSTPSAAPIEPAAPFTSDAFGVETPTGLVLQYPSRDFPPPPVVRLEVPAGWVGVALADRELAAQAPEPIGGVTPRVDVAIRRVVATAGAAATLDVSATSVGDAEVEVIADERRDDPTAPARRVLTRRTTDDGVVVRMRQLHVHVPATAHLANVVTITATWPESSDAQLGPRLTDVVSSVRIFMPQRGQ